MEKDKVLEFKSGQMDKNNKELKEGRRNIFWEDWNNRVSGLKEIRLINNL